SVGGRPFITYLLEQLAEVSIPETVLLVGFRAEQVRATLGTTFGAMRLTYAEESYPLGTAGALRRALPLLSARTVLLLNGDSCCDVDLHEFCGWHRRQSLDASLVMVGVPATCRFGQIQRDERGRIIRFQEKGEASGVGWINAGADLIARHLLAHLPATC